MKVPVGEIAPQERAAPRVTGPVGLAKHSSDAAFVIDGAQRILAWNGYAERLLGVSASQATGQHCYELLSGHTSDGQVLCGPQCAAAVNFQHDHPFGVECLLSAGQGRPEMAIHLSSIVLPGTNRKGLPKAIIFMRPRDTGSTGVALTGDTLRVFVLGSLRLQTESRTLEWKEWQRKQAVTLFKCLLTRRGHPVHREELAEALWPGAMPEEGSRRLKVLVHSLRRYLEPQLTNGTPSRFVATEGVCYRLVTGQGLWVDVDFFQELVQRGDLQMESGRRAAALRAYEEAAAAYAGDYLEADPYNDWFAPERERLREVYLSLLVRVASLYHARGEHLQAVASCRKAVALDPCRESVHRLLMLYLWSAGQRTEAIRQYRTCLDVLRRELDVAPLPETEELYQRILSGGPVSY